MLSALKIYIKNRFGSSSGLLNAVKYKTLYCFGAYRRYRQIDFSRVDKLVFICSGNICRSPFAEAVACSQGANAESYGLHCRGGDGADPRAIDYASTMNVDMATHVTRNIRSYSPDRGDLLVAMEPAQLEELQQSGPQPYQMTLACLWKKAPSPYLHDPFGCNLTFFERCEADLALGVSGILRHVDSKN